MIRTRVGYTGGKTSNPTYTNLRDHTEAIQIEYDPKQISYSKLLSVFWKSHSPAAQSYSRQYKAAVWFHSQSQKEVALQSKAALESQRKIKIRTEILPARRFYNAENYHQKYYLNQKRDLARSLRSLFPSFQAFLSSASVTRINGYVGGHGDLQEVQQSLRYLVLTPRERITLLQRIKRAIRRVQD